MITKFENLMRDKHKGKNNAIMSRDIEAILHCKGTDVRRMANELRCQGVPIGSCQKGYFYAESEDEIRQTISHLDSRMKRMKAAKAGMMATLKKSKK